ncbi:formate dehydrogenase accessory sulfurtransferase FdhD [Phenylobacterium sp.]|uniref:formate dehydrogenase accessory sulfurtransferase FdhD n=1 Tax=Phenylobacterium sp. TaxID=1871053 RepID=UPI0025D3E28B|nr:formate dehydrogenase accessory sulfurtransferase FdhD [Phenylobacterium sp.]MBX3485353.1 formate dehydrogenase accessory sulfurtransferase FdhD [Phenylobacterium sp.]MCW5760515.1 formate dehydrogenase accessory sulfurtransferase FdhD [Phenylobacterium sp.]
MTARPLPSPVQQAPARAWRADGMRDIARGVPAETAVALSFDGEPYAVLMATPRDVTDLAIGFTVSEGVAAFARIRDVAVEVHDLGVTADVRLDGAVAAPRGRSIEGRTGCGLCGVERLEEAMRPTPRVAGAPTFDAEAIRRAVAALDDAQPLGRETRATHAAAFAAPDGTLGLVREDVGRHNALDKLGGALLAAAADPAEGFVVVTSRCSFEMVEKTARFGAPMIVAISAPTALAIQRAEAAGVTLVALARADGHTVFSRAERVAPDARETAHV